MFKKLYDMAADEYWIQEVNEYYLAKYCSKLH